MGLLDVRAEGFHIMDKVTRPDGYGGTVATYQEGAPFRAIATQLQSQQLEVAYQDGQRRLYAIFYPPIVGLSKGTRVKRQADGLTFDVVADPDPQQTAPWSRIGLQRTTMEVVTT